MSVTTKLRVIRPCGMDWNSMSGDDKTRFCPDCGKNVHNVSALTQRQAAALIGEDGSVPCLRGVAAKDGTLLSLGQLAASNRRQFTQTILTALPFAGLAAAQTTGGTLRGVVTDQTEAPIEGCVISLRSSGGVTHSVKTAKNGAFEISAVPAGSWSLRGECPGFASFNQPSVVIREGAETQVSFHLDVGSVGGAATVVPPTPIKRKLPLKLILHK